MYVTVTYGSNYIVLQVMQCDHFSEATKISSGHECSSFFAVAHRLCNEVKARSLCITFCKGCSLQGTRGRTMTQECCFGATEPLDESDSVQLLRVSCDVISGL